MGVDDQAKTIGYSSADDWLQKVREELDFGVVVHGRVAEYDTIFAPLPPEAITITEARLLDAWERADFDQLRHDNWLTESGELTKLATAVLLGIWHKKDRASA